MNLIDCARSFVLAVELGSLIRAADRDGLSAAAITRRIQHLEETLGERLLQRTTRKIRLTETGQLCFERFGRILGELDELMNLVSAGQAEPQGLLRISSTTLFWMQQIAPALPLFLARFPKLRVQVNLTERSVDLVEEGYDLALQIDRPTGQSIVARSFPVLRRILYAAPEYLAAYGTPGTVHDLAAHNCLLYAHSAEQVEWSFLGADGNEIRIPVDGSLRSNDANTLRLAALAGVGIARGPLFILEGDLASGRLAQVLQGYVSVDPCLWVLYPSRRHLAAKVRLFLDFLEQNCIGSKPSCNVI